MPARYESAHPRTFVALQTLFKRSKPLSSSIIDIYFTQMIHFNEKQIPVQMKNCLNRIRDHVNNSEPGPWIDPQTGEKLESKVDAARRLMSATKAKAIADEFLIAAYITFTEETEPC